VGARGVMGRLKSITARSLFPHQKLHVSLCGGEMMPTECRAFPNFKFFYRVANRRRNVESWRSKEEKMEDFLSNFIPLLEGKCFI
jgi:hypothetical protein